MEEIKLDFLESLAELTFNSRPIIQTLTTIAGENTNYASGIVDALEEHITKCPPPQKLPAMYLMDSICKNISVPYADIFASTVYRIFTAAFNAVPEPVKIKLGELFQTWTKPLGPHGRPLFPHEVLRQIDNFLARASSAGSRAPPNRLTQSTLLVDINRHMQTLTGNDKETDYQKSVLERMQATLSASAVDPSKLPVMHQELVAIKARAVPRGGRKPQKRRERGRRRGRGDRGSDSEGDDSGQPFRDDYTQRSKAPRLDHHQHHNGVTDRFEEHENINTEPATSSPVFSASLLSSLQSAGLLAPSASQPARRRPLVELTNASLNVPRPELVSRLYRDLPLQCPTCGKRFPDTPEGRKAKEAEMDWHFRVNKDIREGRVRHRCWYLTTEEWISFEEDRGPREQADASQQPVLDMDAIAKQYIPVPADPPSKVCPVCQEPFATVYNEDEDDWVWVNAVEVEGKIFNATCYADPDNRDIVEHILHDGPEDGDDHGPKIKME